jgi:hypothetical protein
MTFVPLLLLAMAGCTESGQSTPGATTGAPTVPAASAAPTAMVTPQATIEATTTPTSVATVAASQGGAAPCSEYLTAAEISNAAGRTSTGAIQDEAGTPGETLCVYFLDTGSLTVSIYPGSDRQAFYDATVAGMPTSAPITSIGQQAVYGTGPIPIGSDVIVVLDSDVAITLYNISQPAFGEAAMRQLAELVLARVP